MKRALKIVFWQYLPLNDWCKIEKCGKMYKASVVRKNKTEKLICRSYSLNTCLAYCDIIKVSQQDSLNGKNPYVTSEYCKVYKSFQD